MTQSIINIITTLKICFLCLAFCLCQEKNISLHVTRLYGHYTCEELTASLLQEADSPGLSLAYMSEFISSLDPSAGEDADKNAANALSLLTPFGDTQQLDYNLWNALFYGCHLKGNGDNIIQRIYRLGLIRCARTLNQKGLYDVSHYLYSRSQDGDNLFHLAVRSGNPELITLLVEVLHENSLFLLRGELSLNHDNLTPEALARSIKSFGALDSLRSIYTAYHSFNDISLPPLPRTPSIPAIQYIRPDEFPENFQDYSFTSHEHGKSMQLDLTNVSAAHQATQNNFLLSILLYFSLYFLLTQMGN